MLHIRKKFVLVRMVRHWNRFPREVADSSSLAVSKSDKALSNLGRWPCPQGED